MCLSQLYKILWREKQNINQNQLLCLAYYSFLNKKWIKLTSYNIQYFFFDIDSTKLLYIICVYKVVCLSTHIYTQFGFYPQILSNPNSFSGR